MKRIVFVLGVIAVLAGALPAAAAPAQHTSAIVQTHPSQGPVTPVAGAIATLATNDSGLTATLTTSQLEQGHAYTLWLVIINNPENCLTILCTAMDILFRTDIVQAEIVYGAGHVVGGSGKANFAVQQSVGPVPGGWFGNGFTNPRGAEIHLVVNDHGPIIPNMVAEMIHTYRAGCTDESLPPPFPATAKADGTPGPNTCRLMQFAVLQQ